MSDTIRVGIVGVNMGHAEEFSRLINGVGGRGGAVPGARVVAIWGDDVGDGERTPAADSQVRNRMPGPSGALARMLADAFAIPKVVDMPEEMVEDIDLAIIEDDTGHGASHPRLASPYLEAGVATLIEKPMALSVEEAAQLFRAAQLHGAPLLSASALRYAPGLEQVTSLAAQARPSYYAVSDGSWSYYGVHLAEMLSAVGAGRPASVRRMSLERGDLAVVRFDSGVHAVMELVRDTQLNGHRLEARTNVGCAEVEVRPDSYDTIFTRLLEKAVEMARSRVSPVQAADTVAIIGLLELGERSVAAGSIEIAWDALGCQQDALGCQQ